MQYLLAMLLPVSSKGCTGLSQVSRRSRRMVGLLTMRPGCGLATALQPPAPLLMQVSAWVTPPSAIEKFWPALMAGSLFL
jgi:hypothetical protein